MLEQLGGRANVLTGQTVKSLMQRQKPEALKNSSEGTIENGNRHVGPMSYEPRATNA
jgi:hypothetical protein